MNTFSLYGLTDNLKAKLQKIANKKKWSLAKLIIEVLNNYVKKNTMSK